MPTSPSSSPPPPPPPPSQPRSSLMDTTAYHQAVNDNLSTPLWDWNEFLDFNLDDQLALPLEHMALPDPVQSDNSDRIRKRDPRLTCSNFLAGRIPCACPEMDALLAEEEAAAPGKKRARTARATAAAMGKARCQVPGCEADISELKGYHRRHRVCLSCANASAVVLEGENKRYCQQCGKFHILSDFDEGKRSCRRKLERHNNRRRRKSTDTKVATEKEPEQVEQDEVVVCDEETGKDSICLSSQATELERLLDSEGPSSILCSAHGSQSIEGGSLESFSAPCERQVDEEKEKCGHSPSYCDKKSPFSSVCPTGRISFKLYDWNPAEFPRRLRHQIFQWLASMPVELEGYIRPGCTILTMFIAMPNFMWTKLIEDPLAYIHDLVLTPGNMLSGRGTLLVYINNMVFRVMKVIKDRLLTFVPDGIKVTEVKVEQRVPKLHYVHPTCFEAGQPISFVACGSNLLQPKLRFLVSFAGKYLRYEVCVPSPCNKTEEDPASSIDHQLYKIQVPHTEQNLFGPAFVEVENESGLSNFVPILIGDKEMCSEIEMMQQKIGRSFCSGRSRHDISSSCEVSTSRQEEFSKFILDTAWLLKEPALENVPNILTTYQLQRFNCALNFLVSYKSTAILERVLHCMEIVVEKSQATGIADADMRTYLMNMNHARAILREKLQRKVNPLLHSRIPLPIGDCFNQSSENAKVRKIIILQLKDIDNTKNKLDAVACLTDPGRSATVRLLNGEVVMNVNYSRERPIKSCSQLFGGRVLNTRPVIFLITAAAVCFGICLVFLHPQKVGRFATTVRRRALSDDTFIRFSVPRFRNRMSKVASTSINRGAVKRGHLFVENDHMPLVLDPLESPLQLPQISSEPAQFPYAKNRLIRFHVRDSLTALSHMRHQSSG
ncbi:hypothetical protein RJ639_012080 [Escallonia herrerae]|uniref:SBP-type domain-containing protein n=1 Tax=Escallonia herrerae TaxID=1293975 RepID=A0AA89ATH7_9ASTE|nr:hypothetical protein RJ639_012080 [Escallonia herrerae]